MSQDDPSGKISGNVSFLGRRLCRTALDRMTQLPATHVRAITDSRVNEVGEIRSFVSLTLDSTPLHRRIVMRTDGFGRMKFARVFLFKRRALDTARRSRPGTRIHAS